MSKVAAKNALVRITIGAGKAAPSPPIGPALGAKGVKSMDFCKEFNARTANHVVGTPLPTYITVSPDKTFKFRFSAPTNSHFIMKCAGVTKGSGTAGAKGSKPVGQISLKHIYEIAKIKSQDEKLQGVPLYGICGSLISSAKGMGIEVVH